MKAVALYDLDNTLYDGLAYFDLLQRQQREGLLRSAVVIEADSAIKAHRTGRRDYETTVDNLLEIHAIGLIMCKYDDVLTSTRKFFRQTDGFFDYVKPLVEQLRPTHEQILVTAEGQFVAQAVQEVLGLDGYCSSHYATGSTVFTGRISQSLAHRENKRAAIENYLGDRDMSGSIALGDSEGDIDMLELAAHPIAVNPNAGLTEWAAVHGCPVVEAPAILATVKEMLAER